MTIENIPLTADDARRLTERIRVRLDRVSTAWADLGEAITEAYKRRADLALGYGSWAEYADAELRPAEGLAVDVRRQLVSMLSAAGMSTRAIAPTVGVNQANVVRDQQVMRSASPEPERIDPATHATEPYPQARRAPWPKRREQPERIDFATGEVLTTVTSPDIPQEEPVSRDSGEAPIRPGGRNAPAPSFAVEQQADPGRPLAPRPVVGLDGKTYTRPEPSAPRRRPLPDQFLAASIALTDKVAVITRLADDDRFTPNAEKVATAIRSDLLRARDALQRVIDQLPERNL